jgi:Concanavalin A-like lectin/glucanases superfamily
MTIDEVKKIIHFSTYILPFIIIILLGLFLSTAAYSADIFNNYMWALIFLIPLLLVALVVDYFSLIRSSGILLSVTFTVLVALIILYNFYQYSHQYSYSFKTFSKNLTLALIVLVGLAILFSVLYSNTRFRTWSGFWSRLLFYLPCLLYDTIIDISRDLQVTPRPKVVLIVMELILIVWYFFGDKIGKWISAKWKKWVNPNASIGAMKLMTEPVMLHANQEIILANSDQLKAGATKLNTSSGNQYRRSYTISMWVFINANDFIAGYTTPPIFNLFCYGSKSLDKDNQWHYVDSKPRVAYTYDKDSHMDNYLIYVTKDNEPYKLGLNNQKWNQFIFVYNETNVDMYVNGHLVKSWRNSDNVVDQFSANDKISIGDDNNKLYGSISDVTYYDHPMIPSEVTNVYNYEYVKLMT